jgi:hypothetical protein
MSTDSRQPSRQVVAYLDDAEADLQAADALAAIGNRFAAYHLEQAAEKLIRAVRAHRGLIRGPDLCNRRLVSTSRFLLRRRSRRHQRDRTRHHCHKPHESS